MNERRYIIGLVALAFVITIGAGAGSSKDDEKIEKYMSKGNDLAAAGDLDKAMSEYKKVLDIEPDNPLAHNNMGIIYKRKGLYVTATDEFMLALDGMPNYYKTYNNLGNVYYEREYYSEAEKYYVKCIKVKPDFAECYWNLALCYQAQEKYDKAIKQLRKFVDLSNDSAYIGLAYSHIEDIEMAKLSADDE